MQKKVASNLTNLLQETIAVLKENGKKPSDVKWVGIRDCYTSWDTFARGADVEYYSGFGGHYVDEDLLVVGKSFWLERHEYDGSEWWEFKTLPKKPEIKAHSLRVL